MAVHVAAAMVISANAIEPAAVAGAVVIDRASVIGSEEDAAAVVIGKDLLDHRRAIAGDGGVDRIGRELPLFPALQEHRVGVPILLAAGGDTAAARAGSNDRDA